jgi:histidinol-phosphate/aromatic aminotransferase/cobyric acid decarboxylase-like protein
VRPLAGKVLSYDAPSTEEIAQRAGLRADEIIRFDGNTSPQLLPSTRAEALAEELGRIHTYPHGGYPRLEEAIARYAGVSPENIVLGAGADDLILLVTRAFAGPGDRVAIANDPTYPMFQIAVWVAGAEIVIDDGVIVLRTFSKVFGLAGARVGYAVAGRDVAAELNQRQHPAPLSTLSAALAIAALRSPPDVRPILEERERFAERLRRLGYEPLPSHANFLYVPAGDPQGIADQLMKQGLAVRPVRGGIRITVRSEQDDEHLIAVLGD